MTTSPPILRNSLLALPVAVGVAWAAWGPDHALAAAASTGLIAANLWTLSVLGPRVVEGFATEEPDPWLTLWVGAIAATFLLLVGAFLVLLRFLPPAGVAMGFVPLLVGALVTALQLARLEGRGVVGEA